MTGERLQYRSLAGDVYDARPLGSDADCIPIAVIVPGCEDPVNLRAIPYVGADNGARGVCFKREDN